MRNDLFFLFTVLLAACNLYILSTSRLNSIIKGVTLQGAALAVLPILAPHPSKAIHVVVLALLGLAVKCVLIPAFLHRAVRGVDASRENDPPVGYSMSLLFGIVVTGAAFVALRRIPLSSVMVSPLHAGLAISTASTGLFLIIARRRAINQVIGYLVFENAAYLLGMSVAAHQPVLVEMGILLDMLVGVFIMGIIIYKINAEFDSISTTRLETLRQ